MATKDNIKALQLLLLNDNTVQDIDPKDNRDSFDLVLDNQLGLIQDELAASPLSNTYIADSAITTSKHADFSVTVDKLATSSVSTAKIQAAAVQTASVKDKNITLPKLSQAVQDLLIAVGGGTITNNPDDEDLETVTSKLKFKDRANSGNQLGYKIIRQDFDFTNIPANYANSIWEIRYEHDLGGLNATLPANVTLKFNGGIITNYGTITGDNTKIEAGLNQIFDTSGNIAGNWNAREIFPQWYGAIGDGINDDSHAIQASVDFAVSNGGGFIKLSNAVYYVSSTITIPTPTTTPFNQQPGISIVGNSRSHSRITTDQDIAIFNHRERVAFRHFTIDQSGPSGTGKAFESTGQTRLSSFEDLNIWFFKYGIIQRYSLWMSYRDLYMSGNTCHIRLARADNMEDQTNPSAPGSWNLVPGWYHNQLTFDNVLCNSGEIGIWASCMGATFNNVTCQNQQTDGTSNSVLPVGQVGTGVWLEGGGSGSSDSFNINLISYYTEDTFKSLKVSNVREVNVNGWFAQGGSGYDALLEIEDSSIFVQNQTGQSTGWAYGILATDSIIITQGNLKADGGAISLTNSYHNNQGVWTDNGDLGKVSNKYRELWLSGDAYFGTDSNDPAGTGDDGTFIDNIGRILCSRNGVVGEFNLRGVNGALFNLKRSNTLRGSIGVTNNRGGATEIEMVGGNVLHTGGLGSPEGVVVADVGSIYQRTDGGVGSSFYVKESGVGNTGWVAK